MIILKCGETMSNSAKVRANSKKETSVARTLKIELPKQTPDQIEYLERIIKADQSYKPDQVVGGPWKQKQA